MRLGKLLVYFETSPSLRLLRSPNAPFIVDFLDRQFKQPGKIAIPYSDLHAALTSYQEDLQETYPEKLPTKAEVYLADWCSQETRWLQRFLEAGRNEPVFQLTPHTEDVFAFLDQVLEQDLGFIGTESRLKLVIETLADLVVGSSDDPETRLAYLRDEHRKIAEQIEQIETEGQVTRYRSAQIRERFATAVSLLKHLQGDFRAVEESFRKITSQVQQRQVEGRETRGGILQFALDSEDVLKQEDQGVSFYEFVRFILSPVQQERLRTIIRQLGQIEELKQQTDGLETVKRMVPLLLEEATKVTRTNQRLSATLRRLLDARAYQERQRVAQLLREIRGKAAAMSHAPPRDEVRLDLEVDLQIDSPFRRSFWNEPPQFETVDLTEQAVDENKRQAAFTHLASMQRIDWRGMQQSIRSMLATCPAPTLGELLEEHPPQAGMVEVLGYLQLARDDGHLINVDATEEIRLPSQRNGDRGLVVTLPLVTFVASRKNGNGHA